MSDAPAGPALRPPSTQASAVVGRRLTQGFLDLLLSALLPLLILAIVPTLPLDAPFVTEGLFITLLLTALALMVLAHAWYWVAAPSRWARGQTTGMRLLGVRVVATDGGPVTVGQLALRWLLLPADLPFVGLVSMLASTRHQRLGDRVAGTLVIRD
ncbi:RDD family protein [Salinactinospora qingdaonensis]|uniref:RDD family protein n=1 Tax=Salinactinospora qingdaonensis TaxID=702744 RepID=UPI0031E646B4